MNYRIIALTLLILAAYVKAETNDLAVNGLFKLDGSQEYITEGTDDFSDVYGWSGSYNVIPTTAYGAAHPKTDMMAYIGSYANDAIWGGSESIYEAGKTYTIKADIKSRTMWRVIFEAWGDWDVSYGQTITFSGTEHGPSSEDNGETFTEWYEFSASFDMDDETYSDLVGRGINVLIRAIDYDGGDLYVTNVRILANENQWSHAPTPLESAIKQDTAITLSWNAGVDPEDETAVNPDIVQYNLFGPFAGESAFDPNNFDGINPVVFTPEDVNEDGTISYDVTDLEYDTYYFWRVDQQLSTNPDDPNNMTGNLWSFTTKPSTPEITAQPMPAIVAQGADAVIAVEVESVSPEVYTWYKSTDKTTETSADDTIVGNEAALTITSASLTDEGYYYCSITNSSNIDVVSDIAGLAIKRRMAYWPLGSTDGYLDQEGNFDATPASSSDITYSEGPFETGSDSAISIDSDSYASVPGTLNPSEYSNELTIGAWIKLTGTLTSEDGYGIITKIGDTNTTDTWKWALYARDNGNGVNTVRFLTWSNGDLWAGSGSVVTDQWVHVAVTTYHNDSGNLIGDFYVNGSYWFSDTTFGYGNNDSGDIYIGRFGPAGYTFPGEIDDVMIYNYGMDNNEIIDLLYYPVSNKGVCLEAVDSRFDTTGPDGEPDCRVDLYDMAKFANAWMDCGKYPASSCN